MKDKQGIKKSIKKDIKIKDTGNILNNEGKRSSISTI